MKALVYTDTEEVTYRDEQDPAPQPGDAVVRIDAVGVCGSDMHAYHGKDARRVPPLILGHEAAGLVQSGAMAGKMAVLNPLITCGVCNHCLGGRQNLCQKRELIGMRIPGAFAQFIAIPEQNLIAMPDGMDPVKASVTEPAATSLHAVLLAERILARPVSECRALVLGGGSIGLLAALFLRLKGCRDIMLGDTNELRRKTAAAENCADIYNPLEGAQPDDASCDLVIDAVGSRHTRAAASAKVAPGGVISHVGLLDNDGGLDTRTLTLQEITFIGNYTYTPVDLRAALAAIHRGDLGDLSWVETRPLADGAGAFSDLHEGRTAAAKIVLLP
jgi:threonine dehydrogenase-like Zn-dependent dehydrogenase